jgi:hypothetical protein
MEKKEEEKQLTKGESHQFMIYPQGQTGNTFMCTGINIRVIQ